MAPGPSVTARAGPLGDVPGGRETIGRCDGKNADAAIILAQPAGRLDRFTPRPDFAERVIVPTNELFARFLDEKLGARRAGELNTLVAGRGLIGMVLVWFVSQEILGGAEVLPVPEEEITSTIAELFLRGAQGDPSPAATGGTR